MIEQFTSPVAVNNSQEPWLVGEGVVVSGGVAIPSLDFDFITGGLPGTVTFTRASNATQFNSAGTLVYAPHNLILDSEDWSTASWNRLNCTFSYNAATAPNGTLTADRLIPNNGSTIGRTTQFVSTLPDLVSCVLSVYVKTSGLTNVIIQVVDKSNTTQSSQTLNLSTGTLSGSIDAGTTSTATDTGDGWYRFNFAITSISSGATTPVWTIRCSSTGNGTDGILLWGAQLNVGSLQSYNQTTSSAYYGPRFDYDPATLAAQGLLIEEQRTNILASSVYTANANGWTNGVIGGTGTITAAAVNSPAGTTDGVFNISGLNGSSYVGNFVTTTSSSNARTGSVFVKNNGGVKFQIRLIFSSATYVAYGTEYDFNTGAFQDGIAGTTAPTSRSVTDVGNGWLRITITASDNGSGNTQTQLLMFGAATTTNYNYLFWGAQVEQGASGASAAFPTSYIPTTTTALTRNADQASVNTLSPWFNSASGTIYAETQLLNTVAQNRAGFDLNDGSTNNRNIFRAFTTGSVDQNVVRSGGSTVAGLTAATNPTTAVRKSAAAYAVNDFAFTADGGTPAPASPGAVPVGLTTFLLGSAVAGTEYLNGYLRRVTYYPRRLSNAELQAITV